MIVGAHALPVAHGTFPFAPSSVRNGCSERSQVTRSVDFQT
ncbi:Uncharacterised protein [Mycobacteroides abscessus]|nr:Uncharacterised protein [Mycobacteroides abscessus]